jgi:hypothetical protein
MPPPESCPEQSGAEVRVDPNQKEIPMKRDRFWKLLAVLFVAALFYAADAVHRLAGAGPLTPQARADIIGPAMTEDAEDVLVTSSRDGRTLYIWTFGPWNLNERRIPQYRRTVCIDD